MEQDSEIKLELPDGFLLGAAISAHQTEGNNIHSDWWHYEQKGWLPKSGLACDHYNRFPEDFALASEIGLNAFRISIEWARIEPREGEYDENEILHYKKVLQEMKRAGLTRFVTLHHFTLPLWAAKKGGFLSNSVVSAFVSYAKFVTERLGGEIDFCGTINEPEVHSLLAYGRGVHPPFVRNFIKQFMVIRNLIRAHNLAYVEIKRVRHELPVGIIKNNVYYEPYRKNNILDRIICSVATYVGNRYIMNRVFLNSDYIGLNYYFTHTLKFSITGGFEVTNEKDPKSDMGWRTYPQGIYHLLKDLARYNKPIYITENGIANARDDMRKRFISEHLRYAVKAASEGVPVKGYLYWSLMDNYEWHDGFGPRFGLVEVNYETQERRIRESASIFKEIQTT